MSPEQLAAYVTGFVDGEGTFYTTTQNIGRQMICGFGMQIRADDANMLDLVIKVMGLKRYSRATVRARTRRFNSGGKGHPLAQLLVRNMGELHDVVVPFFIANPLLGKKRRDFAIWREIVEASVHGKTTGRIRGRWLDDEWTRVEALAESLRDGRGFGCGGDTGHLVRVSCANDRKSTVLREHVA